DLEAERLKQAGGVALPDQLVELGVNARDDPDVAAPGAEGSPAIAEEVEAAKAHPRLIRIGLRRSDRIDDIGTGSGAESSLRRDRLLPARGTALHHHLQGDELFAGPGGCLQLLGRGGGDNHL